MEEILFRAKIQGTNQWIEGYPHSVYGNGIDSIQDAKNHKRIEYIKTDTICKSVVINDNLFFEKDIIICLNRIKNNILVIKFKLDGFWAGTDRLSKVLAANKVEIIGNIIDNTDINY